MSSSTPQSTLFRRLVTPITILSILSILFIIGHILMLLGVLLIPTYLSIASLAVLLCLLLSIVSFFIRNRKALARFDRLLNDIFAQSSLYYNPNSTQPWDDFDNFFNSYLSRVNRDYASELLVRQVEFSTLQGQINPHFLYNTLDSIRGHALDTGADDIASMAEALSQFFRYSISRTGDFVTVQQELDSIGNYFHIQRYRFGQGLQLHLTVDDEDDLSLYYMPKLSLQPLVENSIAHGFSDTPTCGIVAMSVVISRTRLTITVEDNGVGMDEATLTALREKVNTVIPPQITPTPTHRGSSPHSGLGLNNVNQRIKLFFGQDYGLFISATPQLGTTIVLELPLIDDLLAIPIIS